MHPGVHAPGHIGFLRESAASVHWGVIVPLTPQVSFHFPCEESSGMASPMGQLLLSYVTTKNLVRLPTSYARHHHATNSICTSQRQEQPRKC